MSSVSHSSTLPSRDHFANINSENITEKIHRALSERECNIFDKGLAAYHKRRDVSGFVESLGMVLNTNQKRHLLVPIRDTFVKPSDLIKFNSLSIKQGIALPTRGTLPKKQHHQSGSAGLKIVDIKRNQNGEWGFCIRGGSETGIGIFVSWVDPGSPGEKAGLQIGDYIHRVDDTSFESITHAEATQIFKNRRKVTLVITSYGKIPGLQFASKSYRWVDREGKPTPPPEEDNISRLSGQIEPMERKVSLNIESGKELGIFIRGGAEHGLGIYISHVDDGSVAETNGLKPGDQIMEVNGITFYNILHSDAAKALKAQRIIVIKVKDIGKIPHSRIPVQQWQKSTTFPAPPSQVSLATHSISGTTRRGNPIEDRSDEVASVPVFTHNTGSKVMLKKTSTHARGIMNEVARSLLSKSEMSGFTYYISQYEHDQIGVEDLVEKLLKLLNTTEKMQLLSEVRNIIFSRDNERFDELTIQREINSRQGSRPISDTFSSGSEGDGLYPIQLRLHRPHNIQTGHDDDSLDEVPQRLSPPQKIGGFRIPPPPPPHFTSTPDQQQLITDKMRDRRMKLHESLNTAVDDEGWEVTDIGVMDSINDTTLKQKLKEVEDKLKQEHEYQKQKLLEEQKKQFIAEKEALEQEMHRIQQQSTDHVDKNQLEEEIWRQAEETLRQELQDQFRKEAEEKLGKEFTEKLEKSLSEERKKTDAERKKREELEEEKKIGHISSSEEEEQRKIEMEERIRKEAEEKARQEYEDRLQRESKEKAQLAEEIKSYRTMKSQLEGERSQRQKLEKAKKDAEEKVRKETEVRERLEREKNEAEEKVRKEMEERERLEKEKILAEEKVQKEIEERKKLEALLKEQTEKPKQKEPVRVISEPENRTAVEEDNEEDTDNRRDEEEEEHTRLKEMEEQEEKLRKQKEKEELRLLEEEEERLRKQEEEEELKFLENERKKQDEEKNRKRRKQEERDRARKIEEERLKRLREEEDKRQREEEQRMRQEEEEREREENARIQKEEKRLSSDDGAKFAFDPSMMDDLVMNMANTTPNVPSSRDGHVTFEDVKKRDQRKVENERKLAEQMLAVRLRKQKEKNKNEEEKRKSDGLSYGGYTSLKGKIVKVNVTKVNRKLGIAVDGGANTNQKAVIVRQIVPNGSAALTGAGLEIGQQILTVNGKTLKGLKHKDAVMAIKTAFDGPLNKVVEFVLLAEEDE